MLYHYSRCVAPPDSTVRCAFGQPPPNVNHAIVNHMLSSTRCPRRSCCLPRPARLPQQRPGGPRQNAGRYTAGQLDGLAAPVLLHHAPFCVSAARSKAHRFLA